MQSQFITILLLSVPLFVELWYDRKGDHHPNHDWLYRAFAVVWMSIFSALLLPKLGFWIDFLRGVMLSSGIFILFFPYLINIILVHNRIITDHRWWDHLSGKAWPDRLQIWAETPWLVRMFVLVIIFSACCVVYFCPCKLIGYENNCF